MEETSLDLPGQKDRSEQEGLPEVDEMHREVTAGSGRSPRKVTSTHAMVADLLGMLERISKVSVDISDLSLPTYQFNETPQPGRRATHDADQTRSSRLIGSPLPSSSNELKVSPGDDSLLQDSKALGPVLRLPSVSSPCAGGLSADRAFEVTGGDLNQPYRMTVA